MDELKPCPFCGGTEFIDSVICEEEGEIDGVWCKGCGAEAPKVVWNSRVAVGDPGKTTKARRNA